MSDRPPTQSQIQSQIQERGENRGICRICRKIVKSKLRAMVLYTAAGIICYIGVTWLATMLQKDLESKPQMFEKHIKDLIKSTLPRVKTEIIPLIKSNILDVTFASSSTSIMGEICHNKSFISRIVLSILLGYLTDQLATLCANVTGHSSAGRIAKACATMCLGFIAYYACGCDHPISSLYLALIPILMFIFDTASAPVMRSLVSVIDTKILPLLGVDPNKFIISTK